MSIKKYRVMLLRHCFILIVSFLVAFFSICKTAEGHARISEGYENLDSIENFLISRLDASYYNRLLEQDVDVLVRPFKEKSETSCWQSEFWGKWITSAISAYEYKPTQLLRNRIDYAVDELIKTQTSDGYIGNYDLNHRLKAWDIWGRKYSMLGLLKYHRLTGSRQALESASALARHLISEIRNQDGLIVNKGYYRGMAASSVLEPICLLFQDTKDSLYLNFAEEIVRQWESETGPKLISKANEPVGHRFPRPDNWFGWQQGQKAYEMMSCYEGLLELYKITRNNSYLKVVETVWKHILEDEINIVGSGSAVEMWFGGANVQTHPNYQYQETCVTATWIKLNWKLYEATGHSKYLDEVERSYYNALLGSNSPDGAKWTKYTSLQGVRRVGAAQCGMGINCCEASGPRALFELPKYVVNVQGNSVLLNFYIDGEYKSILPSGRAITIFQRTGYPFQGDVEVGISLESTEEFDFGFRVPSWAVNCLVEINGQVFSGVSPGKYFKIKRVWKDGDKISLKIDMPGRVIISPQDSNCFAIARGPLILARESSLSKLPLSVPIKLTLDEDRPSIRLIYDRDTNRLSFSVLAQIDGLPEKEYVPFCAYADAGWVNENGEYAVWLWEPNNPRFNKL